jgi:hypothetical protein
MRPEQLGKLKKIYTPHRVSNPLNVRAGPRFTQPLHYSLQDLSCFEMRVTIATLVKLYSLGKRIIQTWRLRELWCYRYVRLQARIFVTFLTCMATCRKRKSDSAYITNTNDVEAVQGNNHCLSREPYETDECAMWALNAKGGVL